MISRLAGIHGHYQRVDRELQWRDDAAVLPAIVLVSRLHLPPQERGPMRAGPRRTR